MSKENHLLKLIAIISMLIDHIGYLFFPQILIYRIIGRIAYPIFGYYLVQGFIYTKNFKKYFTRLFLFAIISQYPFYLVFNTMKLNILFTLLFSLIILYTIKEKSYIYTIFFLLLGMVIPLDYGIYGILTILIFYLLKDKKKEFLLISQTMFNIFSLIFLHILQIFSLLSWIIILYLPMDKFKIKLNKYFFYIFYPLHLIILFLIKKYLF